MLNSNRFVFTTPLKISVISRYSRADRCRAEETSDAKKEDLEMSPAEEDEAKEQTASSCHID